MKRHDQTRSFSIAILALVIGGLAQPAEAQDTEEMIEIARDQLGDLFAAGEAAAFDAYLTGAPDGVTGDTLGHLLYLRRHFDRAAYFFGADALGDPSDPVSLNNFAAMLVETHQSDPDAYPDSWLDAARETMQAAVALAPDDPALLNNLGNAARLAGHPDEAIAAARRATELAPDEALYWTNLARALEAGGDPEGAAAALARAHLLGPNAMPLLETVAALPGSQAAYQQAIANQCEVDFRCQEICPRSIIGGIQSVTCEMANMSAQMDCREGLAYPVAFDCSEDLPEYGILIPGLNSGFSLAIPGVTVHVVVQGDGQVDVRVEGGVSMGPVSVYLRGDGHFSPSNGASFDNLGGGVRVNVLPNSPANRVASDLGHPPVHIEAESLNGEPPQIAVETYNVGVISF